LIALVVFISAAITDALDGYIARKTNQKTDIGGMLDPLADKILLTTSFVLFSYYEWTPIWLTIIVITRDTIVVVGWFIIYLVRHTTIIKPSILGKAAIAAQLIFIAYKIIQINYAQFPDSTILMILTAFFTVISGLHYIYKGFAYNNG
jgi:cardiolipin synthase